jgi:ribosomal protein L11 methylase PrmA
MTNKSLRIPASFRDPEGFLFKKDGILYRQVNHKGQANYDLFMDSGLYDKLVKSKQIIPHQEVKVSPAEPQNSYKVICPEVIPFITYPYEWCFSQLKDAALLTLSVQKKALDCGLSLKDASAYNVQYVAGKPLLIDTLSFEEYHEGRPWTAYRQFCQHFLAPLALMEHTDIRLSQLSRIYVDGIPLDLASRLLPRRTRLDLGVTTHIHLHAAAQKRYSNASIEPIKMRRTMSKMAFMGLVENLEKTVRKLRWQPKGTEWGNYYQDANYTNLASADKENILREWMERIQPGIVWDLGANVGTYSRSIAGSTRLIIAADLDPAAVEKNYLEVKKRKEANILPLLLDLTNPSAGIGWANQERTSFLERGPADAVLALALVHHLAISNNVPLPDLARFFAQAGKWLLIEFIPKEDRQVQRLLSSRQDIFTDYHTEGFEAAFGEFFSLVEKQPIQETQRTLYLMERKINF